MKIQTLYSRYKSQWPLFLAIFMVVILIAAGVVFTLNKSEWASWVQAIGSIGTIAVAMWLAKEQYRLQYRDRNIGSTLQAIICCDGASITYVEFLDLISTNASISNSESARTKFLNMLLRSFQGYLSEMSMVQMGDLRFEDAVEFAHARRLCKTMEHFFSSLLLDPPRAGVDDIVAALEERSPYAKKYADAIRASYAKLTQNLELSKNKSV